MFAGSFFVAQRLYGLRVRGPSILGTAYGWDKTRYCQRSQVKENVSLDPET